jgi:FkbM family methyltransferase
MKELLKRSMRRWGYIIVRAPAFIQFIESREVDLVLDVGANVGQFARSLRREGYCGRIASFEPVKSAFDELCQAMSDDKQWSGFQIALGESVTTGTINVSRQSVYSSLLSQTAYSTKFDPVGAVVIGSEQIQIVSLDSVFHDLGGKNIFLKIDTQGSEEHVLKGAANSLPKICGIQLELPIRHLYCGSWSLSQAIATLDSLGFVPAQMKPVQCLTEDRQSWAEIDCTFRRKMAAD